MQGLSALLLSNDPAAVRVTNRILDKFSFKVNTVTTAPAASELMGSHRFDLAVYDQSTAGAIELASQKSSLPPGVVFAMLDDCRKAGLAGKRIHFTLSKPLNADVFARSIKAAYGLILKEKRAAFRHRVSLRPAYARLIHRGETRDITDPQIINLSQTGLCMTVSGALLPQDAMVQIGIPLPDQQSIVRTTGKVIWADFSGKAGVNFMHIPSEEEKKMSAWLDSMLPPSLDPARFDPPKGRFFGNDC
jgi:CheY-like chemotaxis protein